ncbi:formate dehydrogenase subunit delta [Modicisalibacter muralis]|uniref:Formate dehydrogenase subunit delta n=1 Tax=Modicisalibacter muralis TaxID=119000 RepID=A0A1G9LFK4_9GAMM|nr:formate dehydrogenase subunit delta [Halomonas muralis]SDL60557.1 formate dehydrogenase subunit delta [Halomonas muralis]
MSHSQLDMLIQMANQIADNNTHHGSDAAAAHYVATHLHKFWARSMKQQIIGYHDDDGNRLTPVARLAVRQLASGES